VVTSHGRRRWITRRAPATAALITLAASGLAVVTAASAHAQQASHGHARPRASHPGPAGLLPASRALTEARRTGHRAMVTAMTTPTSTTSANPDGTLTVSQSLRPVRAWHDGRWAALNPALHRDRDGRVSPAVTSNPLTLAGGGTSTLAVMTADARTLTVSWPGTLPAPILPGATATYANVLPGVDLVITADDQGGFADTLVVHTAAAAANPQLASLTLGLTSSGLTLSADAAGDLSAAIGPGDPAVITTQAPQIWDSTPPPAGMPAVTEPGGLVVNADNGLPADSSATAPGSAAHVATVPVTLSGGTLTLSPPASVLTGPGITYPVYIDPTWHNFAASQASAWTQVDSGYPDQSYWHESSDLQSGDCYDSPAGSCQGMGVARSFIRMPIPSALTSTTDINSAYLYMTEVWAPSCTKTSVRLYTTGAIWSSTTWNNQPPWSSGYRYQDAAFGYPGCGYYKNDITWDVTSTIAAVAGHQSTQTFGLRAADESDTGQWKQFWSGSANLTMTVTYNYPPNTPASLSTSPGGACHTSSGDPAQIGDDDVTFAAYASDNDGDNNLTTEFVIHNASDGSVAYDSGSSVITGDKTDAELTLSRATIQGFHTDGTTTPYTYYWQAQTTDDFSLASGWAGKCWFTYNPTGPQAPTVTSSTTTFTLGQPATFAFTAPSGCSPTTSPCPASYTYQLGDSTPVTVTNLTNGNWQGNITINRTGPQILSVYGTSTGGNPGEIFPFQFTANPPATPYADGYFHGGPYPDLLTLGAGAKPSLWLYTGSGNGTLSGPLDIGSLGTSINSGSDGPADWAGADILHGDFTGNNVQDVMAYYPPGTTNPDAAPGTGVIIGGTGDQSTLVPASGNIYTIQPSELNDPSLCDPVTPCPPTDLVAAGNASQIGTGVNDLIGIAGNSSGYELALFTSGLCSGCGVPGQYTFDATLSTTAPGTDSWQNYTLATAQPGCYPGHTSTCNQGNVMIFALDTSTGRLWDTTTSSGTLGTWTPITPVPWGTTPPTLLSADINASGQTELWTQTGTGTTASITAYTVSGSTLTRENTQPVNHPLGEWPLTDGSTYAQTSSATTAVDTIAGNTATLTGSATWGSDDYFSTDIDENGQPGYLVPPSDTIPASTTTPKISIWFKTTTPGQVLVSLQDGPLSLTPGATTPGGYNPVLYIGSSGHLYAEWWNGQIDPAESAIPVDDGLWHHAILTMYANSQTLYLDNQPAQNFPGSFGGGPTTNLTYGAGYIGGSWPDETHYHQNGSTGYAEYFSGELADIVYSYPGGP
jgi:hypothetical protein